MGKNYFTENSMSSRIDFLDSAECGARIATAIVRHAKTGWLKIKRGMAIARAIRYTRILPSVKPCFSALRRDSFCSSVSSSNVIHVLYGRCNNLASHREAF